MRNIVVLSVNENPDYLFYMPLVCWAWRKFGWEPLVFVAGQKIQSRLFEFVANKSVFNHEVWKVGPIEGYGSDTISQISRLYAACFYGNSEDYLMTSDIDMLPLSDYWQFYPEDITVWGHDLTGFQHMPICYIGMKRSRWVEVMALTHHRLNELIKRDLDNMPNAKSEDSVKRWVVDQDLITERINSVNFKKTFVSRGSLPSGYPVGRVDRSSWHLNHPKLIDAHLFRGIYESPESLKYSATMSLLKKVWPEENFDWFEDYCDDFRTRLKNGI
jgi:hypothetical protein